MRTSTDLRAISPVPRKDAGDWYLEFLALILLGYALFNRGFAYIGVPPIFLGEVALLLGIVFWARKPIFSPYFAMVSPWLLIALMVWVGLRAATEISTYGLDSVRDAMVVGYGVFAFIVSNLILSRPARLILLLRRYQQFCYVFLILTPLLRVFVIMMGGEENLPLVPGSNVSIICLRMGPVMVHLATITVFLSSRRISWFVIALISLNAVLALTSRGGTLAFIATVSAVLVLRPMNRAIWRLVGLGMLCAALLGISGVEIRLDSNPDSRNISFETIRELIRSIAGTSDKGNLDDTKQWRIEWWKQIVDYTVYGDYFLTGKGFGINLAKDDGIPQGDLEGVPLRSPHNSHLTFLARGGVPAFLLWWAFNAAWALGMLFSYRIASRRGDFAWANVFLFLFGHWLAVTVSTSFDVYLEGPMGGIWFWVVIGVGWSTYRLYQRRPQLLPVSAPVAEERPKVSTGRSSMTEV
jgi:hypothetical protein